jgi:RNA polymerase primary sigma factor
MMMFEELDIMVIDEASKEEIEKSKKLKKKQKKAKEKENLRAQISDTGTRVSDPVKMYLKEMGCISLLTREGEVEIAKRIEAFWNVTWVSNTSLYWGSNWRLARLN